MFRTYIITIFLSLLTCMTSAQIYRNASIAEEKQINEKVSANAISMKTMTCNFEQIKELSFLNDKSISKGLLFYKKPNKIRWEYKHPYSFIFIMNGEKVILQSENNKNEINLNSSKQFQQISKIILGGVSGNGLTNSSDFHIFFYTSNEDYKLQLQPLKKEIKSLFSQINLFVNKGDGSINKVEMIEKTGDKTIIRFLSMKRNMLLNDEVFSH
ncbi:MAG: outer membrane lipoprotein carrier protein LolA [Parabacteroides sp.]|nr:outer membrane lipoprotein carrier protein LolA [Parabacteroides sp.]